MPRFPRVATLVAVALAVLFVAGCGADAESDESASPGAPAAESRAEEPREEDEREVEGSGERRRLVWVGVEDADKVVLVDLDSAEVLEEHRAPGGPHNVAVAADGTAAATLPQAGQVVLVAGGETTLVELGGEPHDVKPHGEGLAVANEGDARIDLVTTQGERVESVDLRTNPHDLAIAPDGEVAWVTLNGTDEIAIIDLGSRDVVRYLPTGQAPHDILFSPRGRVWVTDWEGPVHVFKRDGRLVESIPLGVEAHHLTFTPDGSEAWIVDHGTHEVFVVDTETLEIVERLPVPGAPHHVAITPDGARAAVADHDNGTVVVYDVPAREQLATIAVGPGPHGVWAVPHDRQPD